MGPFCGIFATADFQKHRVVNPGYILMIFPNGIFLPDIVRRTAWVPGIQEAAGI
jgi:hypothetical protein